MPRVSVIVPAYNAEEHLTQALDSIVAQSYRDWEAVVVDDVSSDRTAEVAAHFDSRMKLVQLSANGGPAAARNHGISHAEGDMLAFLDSDDYWLPSYLEHQVDVYDTRRARRREIGVVACDAHVVVSASYLPRTYLEYLEFNGDISVTTLLKSNPIFASALSPRYVVEEAGGFCTQIRGTEDHDLWLRVVELGYSVVVSRVPLAVYRVRAGSLSADSRPIARGTQLMLLRALERGNLDTGQIRIARRELRRQRAIQRIASPAGLSWRAVLSALPLLMVVAAENPRRWRSFARVVTSRGQSLSRFGKGDVERG